MLPTKPVRAAKVATQTPVEAAELAIIRRKTYQLAGQTIAVRVQVVGDREVAENGLYYVHSDHLGSVHILTRHSDGDVEADSLARYEPFGAWRTEPTTNPALSGRGYTGHRHNNTGADDLGLIYMGARFYVPSIGRFASADTIVPEPKRPQSFNRYSYVHNNPLNFTDPSGHCRYNDDGEFEYNTDCTIDEFSQLSWEHRQLWMTMFMQKNNVDWYWNIIGILQFFSEDANFSSLDGWASVSDAGVLQAIQDGWRIGQGQDPIGHYEYVGGAAVISKKHGGTEWAKFFDLHRLFEEGEILQDAVLEQWGIAEQAGVNYGLEVAESSYHSSDDYTQTKVDYFVGWGNVYRSLVELGVNQVEIRGTRPTAWAADPRNVSSATFVYGFSSYAIAHPVNLFHRWSGSGLLLTDYYDAYR